MTDQHVFVVVNKSNGKVSKGQDRKLIRSRCMKGKNTKPTSRRALLEARDSALSAKRRNGDVVVSPTQDLVQKSPYRAGISLSLMAESNPMAFMEHACSEEALQDEDFYDSVFTYGQDFLRHINDDSSIYPREFFFHFDAFRKMKALNSPFFEHFKFDDITAEGPQWFIYDFPFQAAVKLTVSAYKEFAEQQQLSLSTYKHHQTTVALLNNRLSSVPENRLVDTTIYIIHILARIAIWLGQNGEIAAHAAALKYIIGLRGGSEFLTPRPFMKYHMQCLDLASFVSTGNATDLAGSESDSQAPFVERRPECEGVIPTRLPESINRQVDRRLSSVFADLSEVVARINAHLDRHMQMKYIEFQPLYGSILHRLLALKGCLEDTVSECFRVGLLAFLVLSTFRIPSKSITRPNKTRQFAYLSQSYRIACREIMLTNPQLNVLVFWLLTIGTMSVVNPEEEDWLVTKWNEVSKTLPGVRLGWEEARAYLESVLWIRESHDAMGKQAYTELLELGQPRG